MEKLILVNLDCGRKNKTIDVSKHTEEQIELLINKYNNGKWLIIKQ